MLLLHYLEVQNFKRFGNRQHIRLDHPSVLVGPNNCGKTSAIQALALWSQAVRTWFDTRKESKARERTATALNRLGIVAVPVRRTRYFWHDARVRSGNRDIPLVITVGVAFEGRVEPVTMQFRNQGDELVYCRPDDATLENLPLVQHAAGINVELLYPMSGLETEEPILQPGRIDVLLGQGQTAQVLRNLCLMVATAYPDDWQKISGLMMRLFRVELLKPVETARGAIELQYRQDGLKEALDLSSSGRGFQQMLLIFAYLYSHKRSVLLVDEPDAHLEILRQKQVYVLLRDIASENGSQVVIVTHSEVILDEALDRNLTLLIEGQADDIARKTVIKNSLKLYGAEHYLKARERGYVLYVEGSTDVDMLRALAKHLQHPVAEVWDERINSFYVQNNYPDLSADSELERVEGGYGLTPQAHFRNLRELLPGLRGLGILDDDGKSRKNFVEGALTLVYWRRYETENYFITPDVLRRYVLDQYREMELFSHIPEDIASVLEELIIDQVFEGRSEDYAVWKASAADMSRLLWEARTERMKLSAFAEEFFRRLAMRLNDQMLLRKGELHRLVPYATHIADEVREKLDLLDAIFRSAAPLPDIESGG